MQTKFCYNTKLLYIHRTPIAWLNNTIHSLQVIIHDIDMLHPSTFYEPIKNHNISNKEQHNY